MSEHNDLISALNEVNESKRTYVLFYGHHQNQPNACFSQWFPSKFTEGRLTFVNAEQYMMYHKAKLFKDMNMAKLIMKETDPKKVKALGRRVSNFNEEIWKKHRYPIVLNGTRLKFTQNKEFTEHLYSFCDKPFVMFVEASPRDRVWGIGFGVANALKNKHRWGLNLLGKAITQVYEELTESVD